MTMTLKATLKSLVLLAVGLAATLTSADQEPVLKTQKDWQSYAMGVEAGTNLKRLGIDFDLDIVFRGMKDAMAGNKLLLSDKDLKVSLQVIASELMRKKDVARIEAGLNNKKKGEAFLAENKSQTDVVTLPSGLQYKILKEGNGRKPTEADTVECRYRGTHIDGTVFETSGEKPGTFQVAKVIPGWREALKLMSVGAKWQLFIPSQLAYGQQGSGRIGPYETIIFEIELVDIIN
jgi:FKBP-type peptidyl-prolyl cis-trans isomerase